MSKPSKKRPWKLASKVDGKRLYRIAGGVNGKSATGQSKHWSP